MVRKIMFSLLLTIVIILTEDVSEVLSTMTVVSGTMSMQQRRVMHTYRPALVSTINVDTFQMGIYVFIAKLV